MEKKVFCLIGERCKSLKYITQSDLTDVQQILRGLKNAAMKDHVLKKLLDNKAIVLQRPDPDRDNKPCDIDEDDEIPNKSEVSVLLVPIPTQVPICDISDLASGQLMSIDLPVIYEEKAITPESAKSPSKPIDDFSLLTNAKFDQSEYTMPLDTGATHIDAGDDENSDLPELKSVEGKSKDPTNFPSTSLQKLPMHSKPGTIPFPAKLPVLTFDLMEKLKEFPILQLQREFIYFWGLHLWQATCGEPTKQDYYNLATSIVAAYPALAGGKDKCSIVKMQLSTWIRNHRANEKKKRVKRGHDGKVKSPTKCVVVGTSRISQPTETDVQSALKELNKKHKDSDGPHVKRLLEMTFNARRTFIEKEATSMSDVIDKFPQLKEYELLISELLTLKKITMVTLLENINSMIEKLTMFFSINGCGQESEALALKELCERLTKNKLKSDVPQLLIVKEMMGSTENLVSARNESPRLVIYLAEEGVASAFLVADNDIRLKIPEPTVAKSIACLMASYYAWDTAYPPAYRNVLEYLDSEIFGTSIKMRPIVLKFIRERDST